MAALPPAAMRASRSANISSIVKNRAGAAVMAATATAGTGRCGGFLTACRADAVLAAAPTAASRSNAAEPRRQPTKPDMTRRPCCGGVDQLQPDRPLLLGPIITKGPLSSLNSLTTILGTPKLCCGRVPQGARAANEQGEFSAKPNSTARGAPLRAGRARASADSRARTSRP